MTLELVLAYSAAFVGSLAFAAVILTDKIMSGDTYDEDHPMQPLAVSSVLAVIWPWVLYLWWPYYSPSTSVIWLGLASGVTITITNGLYFIALYSPDGETTEVSSWDAASPVAVLALGAALPIAGALTPHQMIGVLMTPIALALLALWSKKATFAHWPYRLLLLAFTVCGGLHMWLLDYAQTLATESFAAAGLAQPESASFAAVYPWYWLGMLSGVIPVIVLPGERHGFRQQWPVMRTHWRLIALVEGFAVLAFAAQMYGFAYGHPAVVGTIVCLFPLWIFFGGILLRRVWGYSAEKFPPVEQPIRKFFVVCLVVFGVVLATWSH